MGTTDGRVVKLNGITKRFGDVVACDDIHFSLDKGQVHGLIGENGAGKTTLMKILYGLYSADSGEIFVNGEHQSFDSPRDATNAGIGMIHQHFMLVDNMSVLKNIVLGHEPDKSMGVVDREDARSRIKTICDRFGFDLDDYLDSEIEDIGVGAQQRVEIVKTLYRNADILILDEPTAVLTPQEVEGLYDVIEELADSGHSIIFITHKLEEAIAASDVISVLRDGQKIGTIDSDEATRQELSRMMVGRDVLFEIEKPPAEFGETVLELEDLQVNDDRGLERVSNINCNIHSGEIFGIAGVEGNGQTQLIEAITGLRHITGGSIFFDGDEIGGMSRRELILSGISYIPEDRLESGVVLDYDLIENALLGNQSVPEFSDRGFIDWAFTREHAEKIVQKYDVTPTDVELPITSFSGGNQQKFVVGRELEHYPDLLVASNPTRGLDVGSIEFIRSQLLEMRKEGTAILLVSSNLDEVKQISDRLAVMYEGSFVDIVDPETVSNDDLGLMMAGEATAIASSADRAGSAEQTQTGGS